MTRIASISLPRKQTDGKGHPVSSHGHVLAANEPPRGSVQLHSGLLGIAIMESEMLSPAVRKRRTAHSIRLPSFLPSIHCQLLAKAAEVREEPYVRKYKVSTGRQNARQIVEKFHSGNSRIGGMTAQLDELDINRVQKCRSSALHPMTHHDDDILQHKILPSPFAYPNPAWRHRPVQIPHVVTSASDSFYLRGHRDHAFREEYHNNNAFTRGSTCRAEITQFQDNPVGPPSTLLLMSSASSPALEDICSPLASINHSTIVLAQAPPLLFTTGRVHARWDLFAAALYCGPKVASVSLRPILAPFLDQSEMR